MNSLKLARIEQNQADDSNNRTLEPDFSHRLSPFTDGLNTHGLSDTIEQITLKADSVLKLLSTQFTDDDRTPNNEQVYYALQSVIHDLGDIRAVMSAFHAISKKQSA